MTTLVQTTNNPSSSSMESDARKIHDDKPASAGNIAIGVVIGRMSEFFDFFVYGIASVIVFPQLFFPMTDRLTGTLYSFAIFSLAFIARPVGSVIFMQVDRAYGRGAKLTIAIFLLGGSTAAMSFLPGYETAGVWAIVVLAALRIAQGLALGGTWDGLASLLALNAPEKHRGWYAMIPQLGAPIGFIIACALFAFFVGNLSNEDFLSWGWRYPFFVAFAINVVALFARLRIVMSKEFGTLLDRNELGATSVFDMLKVHGRDVVIGAFVPLASFALFHVVTVFPLSWIILFSNQPIGEFLLVQCVAAAAGIVTIIASGLLADRIGRRKQLGLCAILIAIFAFAAPFLLDGGRAGQDTFVILGFALLGLSFGQSSGVVSSRFGRVYRYTGAAITSDLAWLIGAGFAPLAALGLSTRFGLAFVGYYLLSGSLCTLAALAFNKRLETRDD